MSGLTPATAEPPHSAKAFSRFGCLGLWGGEACSRENPFVEGDEESFAAGEDGAVGALEFGLVEELAVRGAVGSGGAVEVTGYEHQGLVERGGFEVVNLHVTRHGEDVKGAVELAHSLVEERGDDASVDVAGRAFVHAVELDLCRRGDLLGFEVSVVKTRWRPCGLAGPQPKQ